MNEVKKMQKSSWCLPGSVKQDLRDGVRVVECKTHIELQGSSSSVVVTENNDRPNIISLMEDVAASHVVQEDSLYYEKEIGSALNLLQDPVKFFKYPLSSIFSHGEIGAEQENSLAMYTNIFSEGKHKKKILSELGEVLKKQVKAASIVAEVLSISDELITNAIFNAPFVDEKNSESGAERVRENSQLVSGKFAELKYGCDGERLAIGCIDPFGSLNLGSMLKRIEKCYQRGVADSIKSGRGGAGIGLFLALNSSTSFYASVDKGRATAIYCVLPVKMSLRKRIEEPFNIHIF